LDSDDVEALEEFDDEENILSQRLEGGLFNMQQLSVAIAFACIFDKECFKKAEVKLQSSDLGEDGAGLSMEDVLDILRFHTVTVADGLLNSEEEDSAEEGELKEERDTARRYQQLLTEWCAALSAIIEENR
jgi:hypothetical protein